MDNTTPVQQMPIATSSRMPLMIGAGIAIILGGLLVGWFVSSKKTTSNKQAMTSSISVTKTEAGVKDPNTIKDVTSATGTLKKGGIKGEGTYHLDRPGGATQTVYLTSTIIDMSEFVEKKVQVWGQTLASKNAPWLMDVSKIKVVQ
jgi:hypothetical protein